MGMSATDSPFHVLAVDDSVIDRKLIERLLKTSSYQVTTVDSGSKALEFLGLYEDELGSSDSPSVSPNNQQEVGVNLVITDYCMPGMTGYDLLKKIKESSSLRNIPVVIMSSENVPSRITRCLEEGAEEFFLKPVRLSDLSRLRPHLMKTKPSNQNQEKQEDESENSQDHELEQQQPNNNKRNSNQNQEKQEDESENSQDHELEQQHPQTMPPNNNKRKAMEEGLSPDRTRPRYSGIATLV